jgi:hypothetical protein
VAERRRRLPYVRRPAGPREPAGRFEYRVRAVNRSVADRWDQLAAQYASNARRCFDHLARTPLRPTLDADRCGPLLAKQFRDRGLWQHEVTGAARVWYRVDQESLLVEVVEVHRGHPKETE